MLALATGSAARLRPNGFALKRPEVAAYQELVDLLARSYSGIDARMLEIAPGSHERQQLLLDQIRRSGAAVDARVLRRTRRLLQVILARVPQVTFAIFSDVSTLSQALATVQFTWEYLEEGPEVWQVRLGRKS